MMRIRYAHSMVAVMIVLCIAENASSQTEVQPSGSGTIGDPYLIASLDNLAWMQDWIARFGDVGYNHYYKQTADINASPTSSWYSGQGFQPIGNYTNLPFTGVYDGNGHTIDSLYIYRTSQDMVGMFSCFNSGGVKNLHLTNINITGYTNVGGLVGYSANGLITNCSTAGAIGVGAQYLGGLVGEAINSTIDSCYSTVSFNSTSATLMGGFIGYSQETAISNSYSTGNIGGSSGGFEIGGFAGENEGGSGGSITNSYATGNVIDSSSSENVGGFVGKNYSGGNINKCYCTGNVQGGSYIGGFVGENLASCIINNSYSRGNVVSNAGIVVGGFAGYIEGSNGTIDTCYSTGNISGGGSIGGLVGANGGFVNSSFWDTQTSGQSSSAGGTGKTTTQMKTQSTFTDAGWGTSIWFMDGATNDGYPYLAWQNPGGTPLPVELASITASPISNTVQLRWNTSTEVDNEGWDVEREANSDSGLMSAGWVSAGFVQGAGTSTELKKYSFVDPNLAPGLYSYRLKQVDRTGAFKYSITMQVDVGSAPKVFTLSQNYPNPFNPVTSIQFTVPSDGYVSLKVFDILGREVATLVDADVKSGIYQQATFDASKTSSGTYFARLEFGGKQLLRKMLLLK
ncbi:MAG TPA: GLUG motif-containing protein [Bacteroidota bacterium]|nr:GLUG motif-containing protein [Bacteroidota bacterium]